MISDRIMSSGERHFVWRKEKEKHVHFISLTKESSDRRSREKRLIL